VRTPDGRVVFDPTGKVAGRGAYLCADGTCWRGALEKGTLQRALEVPLPEEIKARLRAGATAATPVATEPQPDASSNHTIDTNQTHTELNEGEAIGQK
jgi:hypothetical protein